MHWELAQGTVPVLVSLFWLPCRVREVVGHKPFGCATGEAKDLPELNIFRVKIGDFISMCQ